MDVNVPCPPEDYVQMNTPGLDMSILTGITGVQADAIVMLQLVGLKLRYKPYRRRRVSVDVGEDKRSECQLKAAPLCSGEHFQTR